MLWLALAAFASAAHAADAVRPSTAAAAVALPSPGPIVHPTGRTRRRRPRYKNGVPVTQVHKVRPREPVLKATGWTPEVRRALEELIVARSSMSKTYDADRPPVAVFVAEDAAIVHHPAEVSFLRLIERAEFRFSPAWWELIPMELRQRAQLDHKHFSSRPPATWPRDEDYLDWRKTMLDAYAFKCRRDGTRNCRGWLTSLLMGPKEREAEQYEREALEDAFHEPLVEEMIRANAGDEHPVAVGRGVRRVPEMIELIRELQKARFDVWLFSWSSQWMAEAVAARHGIDPKRVGGARVKIVNTVLQSDLIDPVTDGPGMAEAVTVFIARDPALIVASPHELELLGYGKGLKIVIGRGDGLAGARAKERGWLLQPPLPPAPPETEPAPEVAPAKEPPAAAPRARPESPDFP